MARTTFTGPVDSEKGFEEVYIDLVTGERTITGVVTTVPGVDPGDPPSLVVGGGDAALDFIPSSTSPTTQPAIVPYNSTTKMTTDYVIDLGGISTKFSNIYSGVLNVGQSQNATPTVALQIIAGNNNGAYYTSKGFTGTTVRGTHNFYVDYSDGSGLTDALTITDAGITTAGDINLPDDAGIYFGTAPTPPTPPSVGPQSNYLTDYEEGTWTPTLTGFTSGAKTPAAANIGRYTRVGNLVTVTGTVDWSGGDALVSHITITGLPYPVNSPIEAGQQYRSSGSLGSTVGVAMPSNFQNGLGLFADPSLTVLYLIARSPTFYTTMPTISDTGTIYGISMTYETNL